MSQEIEQNVVEMRFDNAQFEKNVGQSLNTIDKLKASLNFKGVDDGFESITKSAKKVSLDSLSNSIDQISNKFSAMEVVAITALANITNKAVNAGEQIVKALTVDQISSGKSEYELKMNSVQTIMSGTGESLDTVMDKLEELNRYADKTIYVFSDMTDNIGKFTNAGVDLDTAVAAMKGISNEAALAGVGATEASRAMYNIAQALGTGYMQLIDWKSIENANMATMDFKENLIATAKELGVLNDESEVTAENFRETLSDKWLTNTVLLKTLEKYSDETTELGQKAYSAAQDIKTFTQLFDTMKESVQSGWAETWENVIGNFDESKEFLTSISNVFDSISSASADARNSLLSEWKELGGREDVIKGLWNIFHSLYSILYAVRKGFREVFPSITSERLVELSANFREFTTKLFLSEDALQGITNVVKILLTPLSYAIKLFKIGLGIVGKFAGYLWKLNDSFLGLISSGHDLKDTLRNAFGDEQYIRLTAAFSKIISKFGDGLTVVAAGAIAIFDILKQFPIIGNIINKISSLKNLSWNDLSEGITVLIEKIADFDFSLDSIGNRANKIIWTLKNAVSYILSLFGAFNSVTNVDGSGLVTIEDELTPLASSAQEAGEQISILSKILGVFKSILSGTTSVAGGAIAIIIGVVNGLYNIGKTIFTVLGNSKAYTVITAGLTAIVNSLVNLMSRLTASRILIMAFGYAVIVTMLNIGKALDSFSEIGEGVESILKGVGKTLKGVGRYLTGKALKLIADGILEIAVALALLSSPLIDINKLYVSSATILVLIALIGKMTAAISDSNNDLKNIKALQLGAVIAGIGAGLLLLSVAVKVLTTMKWYEIAGGLTALCGSIALIILSLNKLGKSIENGKQVAIVLLAMGVSLRMLATSIKVMTKAISGNELAGLLSIVGVIGVILALGKSLKIIGQSGKNAAQVGKAILAIATSIGVLGVAVLVFEKAMKDDMFIPAVAFVAGFLVGMYKMINQMKYSQAQIQSFGTSMLSMAAGVLVIAVAVKKLGQLPWNELLQGAGSAIVILLGLAGAVKLIGNSTKTANASAKCMLAFSIALLTLTASISVLGKMNFSQLAVGTTALAILFLFLEKVSKLDSSARASIKSMAALSLAIGVFVASMALLSLLSPEELIVPAAALLGFVGTMSLLLKSIEKLDWKKAAEAAALILVFAISFGSIIYIMNKFPTSNVGESLIGVAAGILAMGAAVKILGKMKWGEIGKGIVAIAGIALELAAITTVISKLSDSGINNIALSLLELAVGISALGGVSVLIGKFMTQAVKGAAAILVLSIALGVLTAVLSNFEVSDISTLITQLTAIAGVILILGVAAYALGSFAGEVVIGAAALVLLSVGLKVLADGINTLGETEHIWRGFAGLAATLGVLIAAMLALGAIASTGAGAIIELAGILVLELLALVLVQLAGSLSVAAIAVNLAVVAFKQLPPIFEDLECIDLLGIAGGLLAIAGASAAIGACSLLLITGAIGVGLMSAALGIMSITSLSAATGITSLANAFVLLSECDITGMAVSLMAIGVSSMVVGAGGLLLIPAATGVTLFAAALTVLAVAFTFLSAVLEGSDVFSKVFEVGQSFTSELANGIQNGKELLNDAAKNVASGFVNGIANLASNIRDAGISFAKWFTGGVESSDGLDINSPSKAMNATATYSVLGFTNGIKDNKKEIQKAGSKGVGSTFVKSVDSVDYVSSGEKATLAYSSGATSANALLAVDKAGSTTGKTYTRGASSVDYKTTGASATSDIAAGATSEDAQAEVETAGTTTGEAICSGVDTVNGTSTGAALASEIADGATSTDAKTEAKNAGIEWANSYVDGVESVLLVNGKPVGLKVSTSYYGKYTTTSESDLLKESLDSGNTFEEYMNKNYSGTDWESFSTKRLASYEEKWKKSAYTFEKWMANHYSNVDTSTLPKERLAAYQAEYKQYLADYKKTAKSIVKTNEEAAKTTYTSTTDAESKWYDKFFNWLKEKAEAEGYTISDNLMDTLTGQNLYDKFKNYSNFDDVFGNLDNFGFSLGDWEIDTDSLSDDLTGSVDDITSSLGDLSDVSTSTASTVTEASDTIADAIENDMDIFSEFDKTAKTSGKTILGNMASQLVGVSEWSQNIQKLAKKGISKGLLTELKEMGPSSYEYVNAFLTMSESEIKAANKMYKTSQSIAEDVSNGFKDGTDKVGETVEQYKKYLTALADEKLLTSMKESLSDMSTMFSEFTDKSDIKVSEYLENFKSQINGIQDLRKSLTKLQKKGIGDDLYNYLAELGTDGYEYITILNSVSDDTRKAIESAFNTANATGNTDDFIEILSKIDQSMLDSEIKAKSLKESYVSMVDSVKESLSDLGTLFSEFTNRSDVDVADYLENFLSQINGQIDYKKTIESLKKKGLNDDLQTWIQEQGVDGYEYAVVLDSIDSNSRKQIEKAFSAGEIDSWTDIYDVLVDIDQETLKATIATKKAKKATNEYHKAIMDTFSDLNSLFSGSQSDLSMTSYIEGFMNNVSNTKKFKKNIKTLKDTYGKDDAMVEALESGGLDNYDQVQFMCTLIKDGNSKIAENIKDFYNAALTEDGTIDWDKFNELVKNYDKNAYKMALSTYKMKEAEKSYHKEVRSTFSDLNSMFSKIDTDVSMTSYIEGLKSNLDAAKEFANMISELRKQFGKDDTLVESLESGGLDNYAQTKFFYTLIKDQKQDVAEKIKTLYEEARNEDGTINWTKFIDSIKNYNTELYDMAINTYTAEEAMDSYHKSVASTFSNLSSLFSEFSTSFSAATALKGIRSHINAINEMDEDLTSLKEKYANNKSMTKLLQNLESGGLDNYEDIKIIKTLSDAYPKLTKEFAKLYALSQNEDGSINWNKFCQEANKVGIAITDTKISTLEGQEALESYHKAVRSTFSDISSIFSEFSSDMSMSSYLKAFKSNLDAQQKFSKMISNLRKTYGNKDALVQALESGGLDNYDQVKFFYTLIKDQKKDVADDIKKIYEAALDESGTIDWEAFLSNIQNYDASLYDTAIAFYETQEAVDSLAEAVKSVISVFNEFDTETENTAYDVLHNLETGIQGVFEWTENIQKISKMGFSTDFIQSLIDEGTNGYSYVKAIANMSDSQIAALKKMVSASETLSDSLSDAYSSGTFSAASFTAILKDTSVSSAIYSAKVESEVKEAMDSIHDLVEDQIDIFAAFDDTVNYTSADIIENMKSQIKGIQEWSDNLAVLSNRGINSSLLEYIAEMGPSSGYQYAAALADMTADELAQVNELYTQSMELPDSVASSVLSSYAQAGVWASTEFADSFQTDEIVQTITNSVLAANDSTTQAAQQLGKNVVVALQNAIGDSDTSVDYAQILGQSIITSLQDALGETNGVPSIYAYSSGSNVIYGLISGMDDQSNMLLATVEKLGQDLVIILSSMTGKVYDAGTQIGHYIDIGISEGLNMYRGKVVDMAIQVARAAYNASAAALGIHSPSKAYENIGKYSDMGLANGLQNYSGIVEIASEDVAQGSIDMMRECLSRVSDIIDGDVDFDPVIRPVLDLTNIQNGVDFMNEIFGNTGLDLSSSINRANTVASDIRERNALGANDRDRQGNGNTYNFTQNNYSPKALSRIDIYRQTSNQFSRLKEAVQSK